jgi:hypothetical protein
MHTYHDDIAPLGVDEQARNIGSKELSNDIPTAQRGFNSPFVGPKKWDIPETLQRRESLKDNESDGNARVEVAARCCAADRDSEYDAESITKPDLKEGYKRRNQTWGS